MRTLTLVVLSLSFVSCGAQNQSIASPTPPAVKQAVQVIQYAINVPEAIWTQELQTFHPDGVQLSPIEAQLQWDFSCEYAGAPNVYFGPTAPPNQDAYSFTGIVVAPATVAGELNFTGAEWPQIASSPDERFTWLGRFVYVVPSGGLQPYGKCPNYVIE